MSDVFRKLNLKDQRVITVLHAPPSFEPTLTALTEITIRRAIRAREVVSFALAFAVTQRELNQASKSLLAVAAGDAILWFAYPKGTSKKYQCEFNRDRGWDVLIAAGFETVRAVSIDEDWSALRFRRAEHVGTVARKSTRAASADR